MYQNKFISVLSYCISLLSVIVKCLCFLLLLYSEVPDIQVIVIT